MEVATFFRYQNGGAKIIAFDDLCHGRQKIASSSCDRDYSAPLEPKHGRTLRSTLTDPEVLACAICEFGVPLAVYPPELL